MKIDNQTKLYFSVAKKPGNFGATLYNRLFEKFNLNSVYIPRKSFDPKFLVQTIRELEVSGCSVSMPLKSEVVSFLDDLDPIAKRSSSVNTILNRSGKLIGYNSDCFGAESVLQSTPFESVVIYGAGSVVRSILVAIQNLGKSQVSLTGRNEIKAQTLAKEFNVEFLSGSSPRGEFDLLINATPASSLEPPECPELYSLLDRSQSVFDLVVSQTPTFLEKATKEKNKRFVPGVEMSKFQFQRQFEIYTDLKVPMETIDQILIESFFK